MKNSVYATLTIMATLLAISSAEQCGTQAGNAVCSNGLCCSQYGFCGSTDSFCLTGCQSQCSPTPSNQTAGNDIGSLISQDLFSQMFKYSTDSRCPSNGFYSYGAFVNAARSFPEFGTTGDLDTRKREVAAFFGQTSHETTGGWANAPDGPYAWGYCFIRENNRSGNYCQSIRDWPCPAGSGQYYGRGPIQLTHNYNYGQAGRAIGSDILNNPDLVATDPIISFKTAIWFWMAPQSSKPSSHDVITGRWTPSAADITAGRVPGYGVITNIINGGMQCGRGFNDKVADRIGFYKRYCDIFGIGYGDNLDCYSQRPFA